MLYSSLALLKNPGGGGWGGGLQGNYIPALKLRELPWILRCLMKRFKVPGTLQGSSKTTWKRVRARFYLSGAFGLAREGNDRAVSSPENDSPMRATKVHNVPGRGKRARLEVVSGRRPLLSGPCWPELAQGDTREALHQGLQTPRMPRTQLLTQRCPCLGYGPAGSHRPPARGGQDAPESGGRGPEGTGGWRWARLTGTA